MTKEKLDTKISKLLKDIKEKKKIKARTKNLHKQMYLLKKFFCKMHWKSYFVL